MGLDITKVKAIMLNDGISQTDLAKKMNVSDSRVSKILNKSFDCLHIKTVHALAKALKVQPVEIVQEDKKVNNAEKYALEMLNKK